jgi:hypothetical protein
MKKSPETLTPEQQYQMPKHVRKQLDVLEKGGKFTEVILSNLVEDFMANHPDYLASKNPDMCPEGILMDENGEPYIQLVCRCKDEKVRALRARFTKEYGLKWESKDFDDDFPF